MARILIVDDDADMRALLTLTLERQSHRPTACKDPADAVTQLKGSTFDLILLDIDMPEMDGLSFARLLRDNPRFLRYRPVPIIMITGKTDPGVMGDSFDAGAVYFLSKPFTPREVLDTISLVLSAT